MPSPPRDPVVDDVAPTASVLTAYHERHAVTYLRLVGAEVEGAPNCSTRRSGAGAWARAPRRGDPSRPRS